MKDNSFQSYSRRRVHFYSEDVPPLLESGLTATNKGSRKFKILDLGCGDGRLIFALYAKGLLDDAEEVAGVDISKDRIKRLKTNLPFVRGIVADALDVKELPDSSFDLIVCAQLIEHVENEQALISEIKRLLKAHGLAYVSSVVKKRWALYFYFRKGSFRLDPTHVREYSSEKEFSGTMANGGFEVVKVETRPVRFPVLDLIARLLIRGSLAEPDEQFYQKHKNLSRLRKLQLAVMGYETVEGLVRKLE